MPADIVEKTSSSPVAATPANLSTTPEKPKTASEHRKSSKPIMEKRRRARINESLCQLKILILDALKKDTSRHSKLEKADILEMTVKHLRSLQRMRMNGASNTDLTALGKYSAGFSECMNEVTRFLSTCEEVNAEVRTRLLAHLTAYVSQMNALNYSTHQHMVACAPQPLFAQPVVHVSCPSQQLNNVSRKIGSLPAASKLYSGLQIVSACDGSFAFLIPSPAIVNLSAQRNQPLSVDVSPGAQIGALDSVWRPW
ncbi:transcription factor HES-1-A-like [Chanos chanos]|uniref:Transcription factor HES-1-A-like n=1 Tax=Chanos chanos TaxID=29144 RepID=A0A6J2VHD6_CHACN|nr:transcription factor HES-1-A-like [Chanos chanos]